MGFGENYNMPYPYSLNDYVKQLKDYIEKNNLVKPNIIAHSFGGRVALKTAYLYPNLLGKIVLCDSAGIKPKFNLIKMVKKWLFKLLKPILSDKLKSKFYSSDYNALSPVMKQSFIKIVNEHLDYTLDKIDNRCLIVFGKKDKETPIYMAEKLYKGLKNSQKLIIDGAGHFPFLEKTYMFNREVKEFLLSWLFI